MKQMLRCLPIVLLLTWRCSAADPIIQNEAYRLLILPDGGVDVVQKSTSATARFSPLFAVLKCSEDPGYTLSIEPSVVYRIPTWSKVASAPAKPATTRDLFEAANLTRVAADRTEVSSERVTWRFPENSSFTLEATLELPQGHGEPVVKQTFTAKSRGWYSVGYMGAPELDPKELESLWQPLVWQERRFPVRSYFSVESMCSIPAVLARKGETTIGVAADPGESPFRQPTHVNSRFGVLLRNPYGRAQPMIFSPVLGAEASVFEAGATKSFSFRLVVNGGDCIATFRHLARVLYLFRDYRENATCSMNETIANMVAYAMNDTASGWIAEQKGSDYSTDVPGSVKNVSALHPLSIAMITDDHEIYRRRALPITEYLLSRQKYLFTPRNDVKGQSASSLMNGPAAEVSELAALHGMFQNRSDVFRHYALALYDKARALNLDMVSEGSSWQNLLALYRMTGEKAYLERAVQGANAYIGSRIDRPQSDFSDVRISGQSGGQFWTDFAPKWVDLLELYEETGDGRHLNAAVHGASLFASYMWMQPVIPDAEVQINKGHRIGTYYTHRMDDPQPMRAPEQWVPAWRISQVGLMPEAANTHAANPAVLLAHYAPYMHRIGYLTDNSFFHDIARSAVVGRYANYPGYDINGEYTTFYQRPDYPLRPWSELTYNNVYYNHVWPMIAMAMDFLISDAHVKSRGNIEFPARYAQGYAYLHSKVYGDRPGRFFGEPGVRLWMPRQMLRTNTIQANYVTGYGNGNFYIALINQSARAQDVEVQLNPDVVPFRGSRAYSVRTWTALGSAPGTVMRNGNLRLTLPPQGMVAAAVDGLAISTQFQEKVFVASSGVLSERSHKTLQTPFGVLNAMLISLSPSVTNAFVWLGATQQQVKTAALHFNSRGREVVIHDIMYPFEFSLPLQETQGEFSFWVSVVAQSGAVSKSEMVSLYRN